ncbi:MAG: alpha/beta hydrolase [Acidobacteriota bacterium]
MIEHRIQLSDGRTLAAAEVGDPDGTAVIYSHGFPGSRLGVRLGEVDAKRYGIRLIAFDRPGWGESDPLHGRRLTDWPRDVADAADRLGCTRFNLIGVSGGAPFALACAAALPDRVGRTGIVCGLGPVVAMHKGDGMMWHNRVGLTMASRAPWLVRPVMGVSGPILRRFFGVAIDHLARHAGPADAAVLADPAIRDILGAEFREAFRHGGAGAAADGLIYGADWGLDLAAIKGPVHLWHGEDDRIVPLAMAHWVAERIPGVSVSYHPGEGHFSLVIGHLAEIFDVLRIGPA